MQQGLAKPDVCCSPLVMEHERYCYMFWFSLWFCGYIGNQIIAFSQVFVDTFRVFCLLVISPGLEWTCDRGLCSIIPEIISKPNKWFFLFCPRRQCGFTLRGLICLAWILAFSFENRGTSFINNVHLTDLMIGSITVMFRLKCMELQCADTWNGYTRVSDRWCCSQTGDWCTLAMQCSHSIRKSGIPAPKTEACNPKTEPFILAPKKEAGVPKTEPFILAPKKEAGVPKTEPFCLREYDDTKGFPGEGPWSLSTINVGSLEKHDEIYHRECNCLAIQETRITDANAKKCHFQAASHERDLLCGPHLGYLPSGHPEWGGLQYQLMQVLLCHSLPNTTL